jgi:hypothetical protein
MRKLVRDVEDDVKLLRDLYTRTEPLAQEDGKLERLKELLAEELKDALRRQAADREVTKRAIRFLGQPMGRSLHLKLRDAHQQWQSDRDHGALLTIVARLAEEFSKLRPTNLTTARLTRDLPNPVPDDVGEFCTVVDCRRRSSGR